jgi:hypothetical protein
MTDVVEIENNRVGFAAIDAGMSSQIRDDIFPIANSIAPLRFETPFIVLNGIRNIVIPTIERQTSLAV